ncbi:type II toxin-antitoxin system Phd/YefM family antitoxin [Paratractidigestivibacter sp.]|uniref:type II toxin-antitoxin system Phd/YefM family antitoxin n=1 Tax=Paratractidigestivibacter sp. TaxID=2847316 RepID=UPI002ABDBBC3|nr:type II toxin-antitoxin system Phd/YefM family antitoxin [Paratractidigestivibacter sp.]
MPAITSLADFNRNQSAVISRLKETAEPLYLTRNGKSAVVVMDAEAIDRAISRRQQEHEREMDVYRGLLAGYQEAQEGKVFETGDVFV